MSIEEAIEKYGIGRAPLEKLAHSGIIPVELDNGVWTFTDASKLDTHMTSDPAMQRLVKLARRRRNVAKIAQSWTREATRLRNEPAAIP